MWSIVFTSPAVYLFLVWITLLAALFAIGRPENRTGTPSDVDQRFSWKWLAPVPAELRPLMRKAVARPGFVQEVLASSAADFARFSEKINSIRDPM